jgi:N-acetylmuramoyl-L-alanine amidase
MGIKRIVTSSGRRRRTGHRLLLAIGTIAIVVIACVVMLLNFSSTTPTDTTPTDTAAATTSAGPVAAGLAADRAAAGRPVAIDPAMFSRGSCMEFPPSGHGTFSDDAQGKTVFLDAGHGGLDPGGVGVTETGRPVSEAQVNLPIELATMRVLTGEGYRVVVSRTNSGTVLKMGPGDTDGALMTVTGAHDDIAARDVCANMGHADLLIGIYQDAGGPGNAGAVTAYDADRPFAQDNRRFAAALQTDVLAKLNQAGYGIPDGGISDDSTVGSTLSAAGASYGHLLLLGPAEAGYFTAPSQMPGALIEPLFITDPFEASAADSARGQRLIADGIARAIGQYFARPATPGRG